MTHFHAFGEKADGGNGKGPANGCCRCALHIAPNLKATRARPNCELPCYMCARVEVLKAKLGIA